MFMVQPWLLKFATKLPIDSSIRVMETTCTSFSIAISPLRAKVSWLLTRTFLEAVEHVWLLPKVRCFYFLYVAAICERVGVCLYAGTTWGQMCDSRNFHIIWRILHHTFGCIVFLYSSLFFLFCTGSIYSPNYPQNYDKDDDCGWLLTVDQNHVVQLEFLDFDVEAHSNCSYDHVAVKDCV